MYDFFLDDADPSAGYPNSDNAWVILIVDDEPAIHTITKFALEDESFDGKALTFVSAFNAQQAKQILAEREDIALVLLDVVMETETAGLDVAAWIREQLRNDLIRIILRTGQPGQAPENTVVIEYDIFDYKNKTELTAQKLFSCVVSGLRSYRDVSALASHSKGMKQVVEATAVIFKEHYAQEYAQGVLLQLTSLLYYNADAALINLDFSKTGVQQTKVIAAVGACEEFLGQGVEEILNAQDVERWLACDEAVYQAEVGNIVILSYQTRDKHRTLMYLNHKNAARHELDLVELFVQSVAIAQERLRIWLATENTLNEMISILSKTVEDHSKEADQYFTGVTKVAMLMAKKHGLILKRQASQRKSIRKSLV